MNKPAPSANTSNNPISGFNYLLKAITLAGKPGIKRFVFIPLLINILVFVIALWVGIHYFSLFMDDMLDFSGLWSWVENLLNLIKPLLWMIFFSAYLILIFFGFSILANLIAAPFNSLLADATEKYLTGQTISENTDMMQLLKDVFPLIMMEIRKMIYFIIRAIPLLILFVIPFTAPIAPILWFLFGAWMMSLQYMDYPMGNHNIDFNEQKKRQKQKRFFSMGYGGGILIATMIPILNFLIIPLAVISATQIWVEKYKTIN
ncbi:MAG: sulfate transporter CysZ [Pseudomonadota bacterium]